MIAQRRRLRALHNLQPPQVFVGDLTESHAGRLAFALDALDFNSVGHVFSDDLSRGYVGAAFVVIALAHTAATCAPTIVIALQPSRPDTAFDLLAVVAELRLEVDLAALLEIGHWPPGQMGCKPQISRRPYGLSVVRRLRQDRSAPAGCGESGARHTSE